MVNQITDDFLNKQANYQDQDSQKTIFEKLRSELFHFDFELGVFLVRIKILQQQLKLPFSGKFAYAQNQHSSFSLNYSAPTENYRRVLSVRILWFDFVCDGILFCAMFGLSFQVINTCFHCGFWGLDCTITVLFFNLEFSLDDPAISWNDWPDSELNYISNDHFFSINLLFLILPPHITIVLLGGITVDIFEIRILPILYNSNQNRIYRIQRQSDQAFHIWNPQMVVLKKYPHCKQDHWKHQKPNHASVLGQRFHHHVQERKLERWNHLIGSKPCYPFFNRVLWNPLKCRCLQVHIHFVFSLQKKYVLHLLWFVVRMIKVY